jgi:hypothetical protein
MAVLGQRDRDVFLVEQQKVDGSISVAVAGKEDAPKYDERGACM